MKSAQELLSQTVSSGDAYQVRAVLAKYPQLRGNAETLDLCLRHDVGDNVEVIKALVDAGGDINAGEGERSPEGAVYRAVCRNANRSHRSGSPSFTRRYPQRTGKDIWP